MNVPAARHNKLLEVLIRQEKDRRLEREEQDRIWNLCGEPVASFERGPLLWLTTYTRTEDQHWLAKGTEPVAPFPRWEYFEDGIALLLRESRLFIPKSREMMTSWLVCGYIAWMTQWLPHIFWVIQTEKDDKAIQLVEYCRILERRQDPWMRERNPVVKDNVNEMVRQNGSRILAVPKGENQVRLHHPHGYMMDEAAFLPEAEQCFNTVAPVAKQIVSVSSDEMGWFHNETKIPA